MAFVYRNPITIVPSARDIVKVVNLPGDQAVEGGWSGQGGRAYSASVRVTTNSCYVGPIAVIRGLNLRLGDSYQWPFDEFNGDDSVPVGAEKDATSFLNSVRARSESIDGMSWIVTLDFTPYDLIQELGDENIADGSFNPLAEQPEVSWGSAKFTYSKATDLDGKPFINTAKDPLIDPPEYEESRPLLTISRNEREFDINWVSKFKDTVNFDTFLGFPPNTVKCRDILGERRYHADYGPYWSVRYEFEIRDDSMLGRDRVDGWTTVIASQGYRQLVGSVKTEVMISGKPVSTPVNLNEDGKYVEGGDPFFIEFHIFPEMYFAELLIPEDLLERTT